MSNIIQKISHGNYDNRFELGKTDEQRRAWREEERHIKRRLKADIELEFGLKDHPKADLLWDMAWERGHSCGLLEVYNEYSQLSDLVK